MRIDYDSIKPIYVQVAEVIEDDIVTGKLRDGEPVYSQLILARELNINPATAAKGINLLVSKGILDKQRGLSMTVAIGARERIISEKIERELSDAVSSLVQQARKLALPESQIHSMISESFARNETSAHGVTADYGETVAQDKIAVKQETTGRNETAAHQKEENENE